MIVARIDDESISAEAFVKLLKLEGKLDSLLEKVLIDKLLVHAAKKAGIRILAEEIQERVDQFRRMNNLHRARDTIEYLDNVGLSVDELEEFIVEILYREKMRESILDDAAVERFYKQHYPAFERVGLSHITLDSMETAREIVAILKEEPDSFPELARQHSLSRDTRDQGGYLGKIPRGVLPHEIEAKIFNADAGSVLGPFEVEGQNKIEVFRLIEKHVPQMDEKTIVEIKQKLFRKWLAEQIDSSSNVLELL
ncbi:MAG: peptidylprolyl isomerase [Methylococcaceae bacterium]|nr:peptidylprolyl isomerase [Methylococcaceae bacterium]